MFTCLGCSSVCFFFFIVLFFCQAEDGIRALVRSRGLGDVYKRQAVRRIRHHAAHDPLLRGQGPAGAAACQRRARLYACLLYTSDAADERSSVDLGGRRIIQKKKTLISTRLS